MQDSIIYKFTIESFTWKGNLYNVALTPQLCYEDDGLDFTGCYEGILIDPKKGSIPFSLMPDIDNGWDVEPKAVIDPNVMDEIDKIISKIRNGISRQL